MNPVSRLAARVRSKNLHLWLPGYLAGLAQRTLAAPSHGPRHLLFALCDHFEPRWRNPGAAQADARVDGWHTGYPALARGFRDADGRAPRHSFFFPGEEYHGPHLDRLADLVRQGLGEVELHLHHDGDDRASLTDKLQLHLAQFARHGHLSRQGERLRYAFIHGNWCLANARADGRHCGVDDELEVLHETGCYADFTFPAAPNESQPRVVNQIYWPTGDLGRRRPFDSGQAARVGAWRDDRVLLIEGPLALVPRGLTRPLPRIDSGDLTAVDPPTARRLATWVNQNIHVVGRPEWVFVKVHTHGAQEAQMGALLGEPGRKLHELLTSTYNDGRRWRLHYVTAREMYNIARAACDGKTGDPGDYRDYQLPPPPAAA